MRPYKVSNKEYYIRLFYEQESDEFFNVYHKRKGTLDECVQDTLDSISSNAKFYVIEEDDQIAAFFVKTIHEGMGVLEGFHVRPSFRQPSFFKKFWNIVKSTFYSDIHIGVSIDNKPAIAHLMKNGFKVIDVISYDGMDFTLLKFSQPKNKTVCH